MRMFHRTFSRILVAATLTAGVVSGFSGCGSSSNDQGSAVTFLGFFSDLPSGDTIPTGTAWISTRLSSTLAAEDTADGTGGAVTAVVGVQNNLTEQYIKLERIFFNYYIEGTSLQPPDTSLPVGTIFAGPGVSNPDGSVTSPGSSMPGSFVDVGRRAYASTFVVPPDIRTWLSMNRTALPEPPFAMTVTAYIQAKTFAGDTYITNPAEILINFTPDTVIVPSGASGGGSTVVIEDAEEGFPAADAAADPGAVVEEEL